MYQPSAFVEHDPNSLLKLIAHYPLAYVLYTHHTEIIANLIPLLWVSAIPGADEDVSLKGYLRGHVARANPLWREAHGQTVLTLFQGPQGYISPHDYPSKAQDPRVVPTWNYTAVQARGTLRATEDPEYLRAQLQMLTAQQESAFPNPWRLEDAPADYLEKMSRAIVGIEIAVTQLEGKYKLSQNRSAQDALGVAQAQAASGHPEMAQLVLCHHPSLAQATGTYSELFSASPNDKEDLER